MRAAKTGKQRMRRRMAAARLAVQRARSWELVGHDDIMRVAEEVELPLWERSARFGTVPFLWWSPPTRSG